jgi:hypothetical protein
MPSLPPNEIKWPKRIATFAGAAKYIDALGFCVLFPVKNVALPSLYWAVTGRRSLVFDDLFLKLWSWKDDLPRRRRALYAKYFRGRGTLVSLEFLPHFLAMNDAPSFPGDHARFYADGRVRDDARVIWEVLAGHGPLATLELRHLCRMETKAGNKRFKRAIVDLQRLLAVSHFGREQETGAWESNRFELICRLFPEQAAASRTIDGAEARAKVAAMYLRWQPAAPPLQLSRLFGWNKDETAVAVGAACVAVPPSKGKERR